MRERTSSDRRGSPLRSHCGAYRTRDWTVDYVALDCAHGPYFAGELDVVIIAAVAAVPAVVRVISGRIAGGVVAAGRLVMLRRLRPRDPPMLV